MQTVLDVRKSLEEKMVTELSEQQRALQKEEERLRRIEQQKEELIEALRKIQDRKVPVGEIHMQSNGIEQCRRREAAQQETVRDLTRKLDRKREELLEASKKKKVMEICKEKHLDKYETERKAVERTTLDELVITGYNRRKEE